MAEIARFLGMTVHFCDDLGAAPHVHVNYEHHNCVVNADNFAVHSGHLPSRVAGMALEWVMLNNEDIKSGWEVHKSGSRDLPNFKPIVD